MAEGIFSDTNIDFTSDGTATNVRFTAAANSFTYTGTTGSTTEVVVSGVATPVVANDSANKQYVDKFEQYDAIVDAAGNGDYLLLSAAVTAGAISIYIRSGIYLETTDIILLDNTSIQGENRNDTIIDFAGNNVGIVVDGGISIFTGTISITTGTSAVTGVGTAFLSLNPGDYIILEETFYEILSIGSATTLTLVNVYNGVSLTGEGFSAGPMDTATIKDITLKANGVASGGLTGNLLTLNQTIGILLDGCRFIDSRRDGISIHTTAADGTTQLIVTSCEIENSARDGINASFTSQSNFVQTIIKNSGNNGISVDTARNVIFNGVNITNSGNNGIQVSSSLASTTEVLLTDITCDNNNGNGIQIDANTQSITIRSLTCTNNGLNGLNLLGGNNMIGGCTFNSNALDGISINGTSNNNSITGNQIVSNSEFGIDITALATDNVISSNFINLNILGGVRSLGTNTNFGTNTIDGVKDNAIMYGYDTVGGVAISATPTGIIFDTSSITQTGLVLNLVTGVVTITEAGFYEVSYWVQCESLNTVGAGRTALSGQIETDPAGGTAFVVVAGSTSGAYIREQGTGIVAYGCGKTVPILAAAGETLRITFFKGVQSTTARTKAGESSIYIKRLGP